VAASASSHHCRENKSRGDRSRGKRNWGLDDTRVSFDCISAARMNGLLRAIAKDL